MRKCSASYGFTLIELMIVIAIIALIAAIAIPSMLRTRINANEVAAVAACKTYGTAQEIYRRTDYNTDGTLEYSQHLGGPDSLLERASGSGDLAMIDRSFAAAEGGPAVGTSKAGYVFTILTTQGVNSTGGLRSYMSGTALVTGFAGSAVPGSYDGTGRNTFLINHAGTIYQSDRGPAVVEHETVFDVDPVMWTPAN